MEKKFTPGDLYWAFLWLTRKIYYSIIPIRFLFLCWRLKGFFRSLDADERSLIRQNLCSLLGDPKCENEIRLFNRRHFKYLEAYEPMHILPKLKRFVKSRRWSVEGLQNLDSALSRGKGVILLSAHFGYAPLLKDLIELKGYKVRRVRAKKSRRVRKIEKENKQTDSFTHFRRLMYKQLYIEPTGMDDDDLVADFNVRPLVESLKKNEIIMILGDALHSVNFAHIKILEQVYPFPTGFMTIAMNTGATILPTFAVDDFGGYGIKIVIEKPLELEKNGATNQELTTINIEHYVRIFESYVKRYPHLFKIWTKENWFEKRRARSRKDLSKRY